jgi:tetratricopeptide (TPR) repeat protein
VDEEDKYIGKSKFLDWMEKGPAGRRILDVLTWYQRLWHLHIDRYRLWDETFYRICTWLVTIIVAAILAETTNLAWRYYRHHEETRAQAQAQSYLARGDYRNASLSANRALAFNPNNLGACRVMTDLAERTHSPTTLDWLGRIVRNEPTVPNKLRLAMAGLRYQPPPFQFTAKLLQDLASTASNNADYQVAVATLDMDLHHLTEAKDHFATAARLDPGNQYSSMSVALLELLSTNRPERIRALTTLDNMRTNESVGIFALRGLVTDRISHRDFNTARIYSNQLVSRPQATLADHLQNLGILHQLHSEDFPPRMRALEQQVMNNEQSVAEVSAWMRDNGLVEDSLQWMKQLPNSMLDRPQIQMNRAQGYLQSSNWARLQEVASQGDWGDLEYLRFALVSHACSELGANEMADSNWQAAMKEASSHLQDMIKLLNVAENWNLKHEHEQLLLWMIKDYPDERWERKLVAIYFDDGNTLGLHQLYTTLMEYFPTNVACQTHLAATEMLLKINLEEAYDLSQDAYSKDPANPAVAVVFAYGLHMQDRDLQGIDALKNLPPADLHLPNVALYYGVLLASAGRTEEAKTWLNLARANAHYLPEERQLLQTALAQVNSVPPPSP